MKSGRSTQKPLLRGARRVHAAPRQGLRRGRSPVQDGKRVELLIGGRVGRFIPSPTFNLIIVPLPRRAFRARFRRA